MAQQVRFHVLGDPGALRVFPDDQPEHHARKPGAAFAEEELAAGAGLDEVRPARGEVGGDGIGGLRAHGHDALLRTFAKHPQVAVLKIDLLDVQPREFGDAQPARVEQFQQRAIPQRVGVAAVGRGQQAAHLGGGERAGNAAHELGTGKQRREIVLAHLLADEVAGESAQGREFPRQAGDRVVVATERADPPAGLVAGDSVPAFHAVPGEIGGALREVALVAFAGAAGKSAFQLQETDETVDLRTEGRRRFQAAARGTGLAACHGRQRALSSAGAAASAAAPRFPSCGR